MHPPAISTAAALSHRQLVNDVDHVSGTVAGSMEGNYAWPTCTSPVRSVGNSR